MSQALGNIQASKNNYEIVAFASAARTATVSSDDLANPGAHSAYVVIDCTAVVSSPSVVFTVEGKDPASGKYFVIATSAAIVGTGTTVIRINDALTASGTTIYKDAAPPTFKVKATHGNANSITYSVGVMLS
jgi:hypothetical protein